MKKNQHKTKKIILLFILLILPVLLTSCGLKNFGFASEYNPNPPSDADTIFKLRAGVFVIPIIIAILLTGIIGYVIYDHDDCEGNTNPIYFTISIIGILIGIIGVPIFGFFFMEDALIICAVIWMIGITFSIGGDLGDGVEMVTVLTFRNNGGVYEGGFHNELHGVWDWAIYIFFGFLASIISVWIWGQKGFWITTIIALLIDLIRFIIIIIKKKNLKSKH